MEQSTAMAVATVQSIPAVPTILEVVCKSTGMRFAAVARVTEQRWVACAVLDNIDFGLKPSGELRIETTICNEIRGSREAVVIDRVSEDAVFRGHPTPAMYGFQSYISMPIILADGSFFGTLCAIDPEPARINTKEIIGMFRLFAELIAFHIDARHDVIASKADLARQREMLARSQSELSDAKETSGFREQFIAVLGHDLRNPLFGLTGGIQLLRRRVEDEKSRSVLQMMAASASRMNGLINNMMDFARGRFGGGIALDIKDKPLEPTLMQVIDEMRSAWPDRIIAFALDLGPTYRADHPRLAQLFSNLLGNAVLHGAPDQPIRVKAVQNAQGLVLSVANGGEPISAEKREKLFLPFSRGEGSPALTGLGLGLFIAAEIAKAHSGTLDVSSDRQETRFTLSVPA